MFKLTRLGSILLAISACACAGDQYLLRTPAGKMDAVTKRYGLAVVQDFHRPGRTLVTVQLPAGLAASILAADRDVENIEPNQKLSLPASAWNAQRYSTTQTLKGAKFVNFYGAQALDIYVNQPAGSVVNIPGARAYNGLGTNAIVAVLDTGVDTRSTVLAGSLTGGWDFVNNLRGGSEWTDLDQSTTAILDQSTTAILDQSTTAILDQSTTAILDKSKLPEAFGHGTMVAGIVHLVAPKAQIMPVKVFAANGSASISNIVRGIYWAVDNHADVLSMSFSSASSSKELQAAINYALDKGVICVASVGNSGEQTTVYPAGYPIIGVGSTNDLLQRSSFSNYGNNVVDVAAPGEDVITIYPGNHYAAGWGTSFSAPFVAGGAALIVQLGNGANESQAARALSQADWIGQSMGAGELDLMQACLYELWHSR